MPGTSTSSTPPMPTSSGTCGGLLSCRPTRSPSWRMPPERPTARAQRRLARELTTLVHGEAPRSRRTRERGVVRAGGTVPAGRADVERGAAGGAVAELKPGAPDGIIELLVAPGFSGQQRGSPAHHRRGRRVRSTTPESTTRTWAPRPSGLPPRTVAGATPRQAEYRRGRAR